MSLWFQDSIFGCFHREEGPSYKITSFNCLDPCGIDGVAADGMHPMDSLLCGWEVIYAKSLNQSSPGFLGWCAWLPLASVLDKRDAVATMVVTDPNEKGFASAGDEDVMFLVDGDAILCKNGNRAIVTSITYAHQRLWKVMEGFGV